MHSRQLRERLPKADGAARIHIRMEQGRYELALGRLMSASATTTIKVWRRERTNRAKVWGVSHLSSQ